MKTKTKRPTFGQRYAKALADADRQYELKALAMTSKDSPFVILQARGKGEARRFAARGWEAMDIRPPQAYNQVLTITIMRKAYAEVDLDILPQ